LRALKPESVIEVKGVVKKRSPETINPDLPTGAVEVAVKSLQLLSLAEPMPIPTHTNGYEIDEEIRLKYRYLDLRRSRLQQNIKDRSQFVAAARKYLYDHDFTEIETPMLTKATKEGSRDFIVPSRLQPGKFFALPQSPQQYKQLLMTAGFERYFQIARCIRDEDPRADRGYEHSQIDMEMSFVAREDVMGLTEGMIVHAVEALGGDIVEKPFPIFTYQDSMNRFGADKFDLRSVAEKKAGKLSFAWVVDFPFFKKVDNSDAAELEDGKSGWTFTHNPFSQPKAEHLDWHLKGKNIDQILTTQYDLVCNGYEVGGGSIRAHRSEVLEATYKIMGYSGEEIHTHIGHMLEAFKYGTPPHGGIAPGVERLLMILKHEEYLREVQAFPQTGTGRTSVMNAPSEVSPDQLAELGISVKPKVFASVYSAILDLLKSKKISYQEFEHQPVFTSKDASKARAGTSLHQGAKALVLRLKAGHGLLVIPGDVRADLKAVRKYLHYSNAKLEAIDVLPAITGLEAGAIPPFGSLLGLPTYLDSRLSDNQEIVFNAGRHDRSIKLNFSDYLSLEKPEIITISGSD
jgi:aspartyl-tRNA synthetase